MIRKISISEICSALSLSWVGEDVQIQSLYLAGRSTIFSSVLSYASTSQWLESLLHEKAVQAAIVCKSDMPDNMDTTVTIRAWIFSEDPECTFYGIHDFLLDHTDFYDKFQSAPLIGEGCHIHPTAVINPGVQIGNHVHIDPFVVLFSGTQIGNNAKIDCGAAIGGDGFQSIRAKEKIRTVRHCGQVLIGNDVHIGSHTVIHRSLFEGATTIGHGSKLDALTYVAHNCLIGENVVITAGVVLCGSAIIESGVWLGPNASVLNKVIVGKGSMVGMSSAVTREVPPSTLVYGVPAKKK